MSRLITLFSITGALAFAQAGDWHLQFQARRPPQPYPVAGRITTERSDLAKQILDDTNLARNAFDHNDPARARLYVDDALKAIGRIEYETANPLHFVSVYDQVGPATGNAVPEHITSVAIDTNMLKDHLEAARTEFETGNLRAAGQALAAAQGGVATVLVLVDNPLLQAHHNLAVALELVQQERYEEARLPLRQAAIALYNYQAVSPERARDARVLSRQLRYYAANVDVLRTDAVQHIGQWQGQVNYWSAN